MNELLECLGRRHDVLSILDLADEEVHSERSHVHGMRVLGLKVFGDPL
jgi:hypothetical protein